MYVHLLEQVDHVEDCTAALCADACGYEQLHDWLSAPLLPFEVREHERFTDRRRRLLAGEIPA